MLRREQGNTKFRETKKFSRRSFRRTANAARSSGSEFSPFIGSRLLNIVARSASALGRRRVEHFGQSRRG